MFGRSRMVSGTCGRWMIFFDAARLAHCFALTLLLLFPYTTVSHAQTARPACPAQEFDAFIKAFQGDIALQKEFTNDPLLRQRYDFDTPPADRFISQKQPRSQVRFPLMFGENDREIRKIKVFVSILTAEMAKVRLASKHYEFRQGRTRVHRNGYKESLVFRKQNDCWYLTEIIDETMPPPRPLLPRDPVKAKQCVDTADKLWGDGWVDPETYVLALNAYVCAARYGSGWGSVRAAGIGGTEFPIAYQRELLVEVAQEDAMAMWSLAELDCNKERIDGPNGICEDPIAAEQEIIAAIKMGSEGAIVTYTLWLERGNLGRTDIPNALACAQLGADRNEERSIDILRSLQKNFPYIPPAASCVPPE